MGGERFGVPGGFCHGWAIVWLLSIYLVYLSLSLTTPSNIPNQYPLLLLQINIDLLIRRLRRNHRMLLKFHFALIALQRLQIKVASVTGGHLFRR